MNDTRIPISIMSQTQTSITIRQLLEFHPENDREREIYTIDLSVWNEMKEKLDKDTFYLGGQIKMKYDDEINQDSFNQVREINKKREIEYGGPCNCWEMHSIEHHRKMLDECENMWNNYLKIMKLRENK